MSFHPLWIYELAEGQRGHAYPYYSVSLQDHFTLWILLSSILDHLNDLTNSLSPFSTKIKNQRCPEPRCDFATSDPGSLTRHRKRLHKYVPEQRKRHSHRPRPSRDNDGLQFVAWTNDSNSPSERRSNCYSLATSNSLSSASGEAYHHLSQVERSISPSDSEQTDSRYSPAYSSERIPSDSRQVTWQNYSVFPTAASEHESSARPSCPALGLKHMDSENSAFSGQMALSDSLHISSGMDHRCLLRPAWSPAHPVSPPPVSGQIENRYTLRPAREAFSTSPLASGKTKNRFSIETRDSSVTYLLYKPRTQPTTQNCDQQRYEG